MTCIEAKETGRIEVDLEVLRVACRTAFLHLRDPLGEYNLTIVV